MRRRRRTYFSSLGTPFCTSQCSSLSIYRKVSRGQHRIVYPTFNIWHTWAEQHEALILFPYKLSQQWRQRSRSYVTLRHKWCATCRSILAGVDETMVPGMGVRNVERERFRLSRRMWAVRGTLFHCWQWLLMTGHTFRVVITSLLYSLGWIHGVIGLMISTIGWHFHLALMRHQMVILFG